MILYAVVLRHPRETLSDVLPTMAVHFQGRRCFNMQFVQCGQGCCLEWLQLNVSIVAYLQFVKPASAVFVKPESATCMVCFIGVLSLLKFYY